ncbi:alpha-N-acetylglucosaminidase [Hoylesella oralis]|uniref:alpha-N-acetylglucosaminidase n=1 Tax=Hoylesella oralis TaxID=28134 RepID=UPI0028EE595C|nr:alpha-N-acetylglucosaminidase [Hoylesella oralis]
MKRYKFITWVLLMMLFPLMAGAQDRDLVTIQGLAERLMPQQSAQFQFIKLPAHKGKDCFTLASKGGKIVISGNNANSMAVGLNYYLNNYCRTTVSWYAEVPVVLPAKLPDIKSPVSSSAKVARRFFFNYCTYGYTVPFFSWKEWERLIDWMALNGINMPLAITGQETVWYNVWKKLGMTDNEIRSYFTGPTYLPWHRMANIDRWNGPLPKEWLDGQKELQKKILARERAFNMKPVLPAFAGHVPVELKRIFPDANIKSLGKWGGFEEKYLCHFLSPEEPLFSKIQKLYLEEQTALFGTDHIYGVDPFNEVEPPSWEPAYLKKVSKNMYGTLTAVDPKAEWMQMGWMFSYDNKHWTPDRVQAFLTGVPKGKMSLLDYYCENVELWKTTDGFYGQPYIWCYLGNFGGNTTLMGNVKESGRRLDNALTNGQRNMLGAGSTLEGLDVIQFPYEYLYNKLWSHAVADSRWIDDLADRHYGGVSPSVRKAWHILFNDIYVQVSASMQGVLTNFRPALNHNYPQRTAIEYPAERLEEVWRLLLDVPRCDRNELQLDIIAVGRQVLGNRFAAVKTQFDSAYVNKDIPRLKAKACEMEELLGDLDCLTSFNSRCSINRWIDDARKLGSTKELKDYYEKNARNLITTWGGNINDYASRTWGGLIGSYYAHRWHLYIDDILAAAEANKEFDQNAFNEKVSKFEQAWIISTEPITVPKRTDLLTFCRILIQKYGLNSAMNRE